MHRLTESEAAPDPEVLEELRRDLALSRVLLRFEMRHTGTVWGTRRVWSGRRDEWGNPISETEPYLKPVGSWSPAAKCFLETFRYTALGGRDPGDIRYALHAAEHRMATWMDLQLGRDRISDDTEFIDRLLRMEEVQ